jgi:hypothetical protein
MESLITMYAKTIIFFKRHFFFNKNKPIQVEKGI